MAIVAPGAPKYLAIEIFAIAIPQLSYGSGYVRRSGCARDSSEPKFLVLENGRIVLADTGARLLANEDVRKAYLGG